MLGSGGQDLAAAGTAGLQDVAAGAGLHAGAEAVDLGTLTLLGLIGTDRHVGTLLTKNYVAFAASRRTMPNYSLISIRYFPEAVKMVCVKCHDADVFWRYSSVFPRENDQEVTEG